MPRPGSCVPGTEMGSSVPELKKILVVKLRNIGDVLLTSPVFANLRRNFPEARLSVLVNAGTEEMLDGNSNVDNVIVYDRDRLNKQSQVRRFIDEFAFLRSLRQERFDLVINLTEGDRGAIVAFLSGAPIRVGMDSAGRGMFGKNRLFTHLVGPPDSGQHMVEQNLRFLAPLGVPVREMRVSFSYESADREVVETFLSEAAVQPGRYFHVHLTSRWMFKTMPPAAAAGLVDRIAGYSGLTAVLSAAPVEKELGYLERVIAECRRPVVDLGGKLTLKQTGALSATARFFVGVDSAPMHIAAALDVPTLGIFGPSSPTHWGPWDNSLNVNPYKKERGIQFSSRHMVLHTSRECYPCWMDGCNGSKVSDCLEFQEYALDDIAKDFLAHIKYDCSLNQ